MVTVLSSKSRQPERREGLSKESVPSCGGKKGGRRGQLILTHVTALAVLVVGQAGVRRVVPADHASIVVDHSVQVIHGQLLLALPADAELAQVQAPREGQGDGQGEARGRGSTRSAVPRSSPELSPDREVHHVVDLVPPNKAAEGEALELDDEDVGQAPQHQLLGGLAVLLALGAVPAGSTCSLPMWGEPWVSAPHTWIGGSSEGHLRPPCQEQASTAPRSAGVAPCWLLASLPSTQPSIPGCQEKGRAGAGSSRETPAAAWARGLERAAPPSSPRFLRGQDFGLGEEVEALLQGEVASPRRLAG